MESPTFQDKTGTTWDLSITLGKAMKIDNSTFEFLPDDADFCFLQPDDNDIALLIGNKQLQQNIAFILCLDQLEKNGISSQETEERFYEWGNRLNGPVLAEMYEALGVAFTDFFPDQKTILSAAYRQQKKMIKKAAKRFEKIEKEFEEKADQMVDKIVDQKRGEFFGGLQESLDGDGQT